MASAFRRGKKIYIKFRGVAGKWQMRPTAHTKLLEARNFAAELEARFQRSRDGLEPAPRDPTRTFGWLYEWWWKEYGSKRRAKSNVEAHRICQARVLPHLGELPLTQVTQGAIEAMLAANEGPWETPEGLERAKVGEESINKLRAVVHLVISRASDRDMWPGANPAKLVRRRKPGRQAFETLRADEVGPLLHALEEKDRPLFATAMWQAMRKGELLGLRKSDVDLHELTITIRRSWDQDRPKSGDAEVIPIAEPVVPYLREAMANSPSELVFPGSNGQMQHVKTRLEYKLRWALARAGITHGWLHTCRRCKTRGTPYEQRHDDEQLRHCPQCNMKLWPKALLRKIRFHDLRATTATLLARAGVSVQIAQKILRHSDPKLTANIYSRVEMSDMRTALNSIRPEGLPDAPQAREAVAVGAEGLPGLGADVVRWSEPASGETVGPSAQLNNPGVLLNRGERIRTSDLLRPRRSPTDSSDYQSVVGSGKRLSSLQGRFQSQPPAESANQSARGNLGATVVQSTGSHGLPSFAPSRPLRALPTALLSVRDVAAALGVSTATVYALVEAGTLAHLRVSNAIRIERAALDTYLATLRGGTHG